MMRLPLLSSKMLDGDGSVTVDQSKRWSHRCFSGNFFNTYSRGLLWSIPLFLFIACAMTMARLDVFGATVMLSPPTLLSIFLLSLGPIGLIGITSFLSARMMANSATDVLFPESMYCSDQGLGIGEGQECIPWDGIRLVQIKDLIYRGLRRGEVLEFYVDESTFSTFKKSGFIKNNFVHFLDPATNDLVEDEYQGVCLRLPLQLFPFETDRQKFLQQLSAHVAPQLVLSDLEAAPSRGDSTSYTSLWLDELRASKTASSERVLEPGYKLKNYTLEKVLGVGGFSVVYAATNSKGEHFAIKELMINSGGTRASKDSILNRIVSEIEILKTLDHSNIVKCLDSFMEGGRVYIVMEAVRGKNLRDHVRENGPLSVGELESIALQCCGILKYLHERPRPIIHRDFSPDNLLWDGQLVKLIDFNVAEEINTSSSNSIVGKHAFLSPEQWCGTFNETGDLYQCGCTLFFLATGKDPEPLAQSDPRQLRADLPLSLATVICKLTEQDSVERYASADATAQALLQERGG